MCMTLIRWICSGVLLLLGTMALGQLEVQVINEQKENLSYVEVYTNDFSFSTLSDEQGKVIIPARVKSDQVIIFNFLGYEQRSFAK